MPKTGMQLQSHLLLTYFLTPELSCRGTELANIWFQQDGATDHTARASTEVFQEMFPGHVISLRGELPWPARSPDLSACNYFLWGAAKLKCTPLDQEPAMTSISQF
jgi:hypothetical protein